MNNSKFKKIKGQVLMEFILLILALFFMGFFYLSAVNNNLARLWQSYVGLVTSSDPNNPNNPIFRDINNTYNVNR